MGSKEKLKKKKNILYVYTGGRSARNNKYRPKEFFYGYHELKKNKHLSVDFIEIDNLFDKKDYFSLNTLFFKIKDTFFLKYYGIGFRTHQLIKHRGLLKKYDVIIGTNDSISLGLMEIKKKFKHQYKIIYLNMGLTNNINILKKKRKKFLFIKKYFESRFKLFHKVLSVGKNETIFFKRIFKKHKNIFQYIGFCIDTQFWKKLSQKKIKHFLFVGSEINRDFSMAFKIAKINPKYNFVFVTNFRYKNNLPNLKVYNGSFKRPAISDSLLLKLYNQAYCVFLPIKSETTLPSGQSVAMQAMSTKCPVVISNYHGLWDKDVLRNKNNVYIVKNSVSEFSKALLKTVHYDETIKIRNKARETMIRLYSLDLFAKKLLKYF